MDGSTGLAKRRAGPQFVRASNASVVAFARKENAVGRILLMLVALLLAGIPLVGYLWETLNAVLALHFEPRRLLISVPVLLALMMILLLVARTVQRLDPSHPPTERGT
jgi:hypothetical protein